MKVAAGIDIGGTNIKYGLVDARGKILYRGRIKTRTFPLADDFADYFLHESGKIIAGLDGDYELGGIGIGSPNGNHITGCVEYAPNLHWKGRVELARIFTDKFGIKTYIDNDANAAALGELLFGNGRGMKNFVMLTLGTGLGSGIIVDGKLLRGSDGLGGEAGHTIVVENGRQCGCGRKGCLETYVSATALMTTYREITGKNLPARDISDNAAAGEPECFQALDQMADTLAKGLANLKSVLSPEAFIIAGGISAIGEAFLKPVRKYFDQYVLNIYTQQTKIMNSALEGADAAILGAASLGMDFDLE